MRFPWFGKTVIPKDKKTYESVKVGDRIRAAVRRDRIVRVDWL